MFRLASLFGLLGLAAVIAILIWSGAAQVLQALEIAGWGIVLAAMFHIVPMICCILGWHALMPGRKPPSRSFMLFVLWLRSSVNNMMPVARIGGEALAVRVMMKNGVGKGVAIASTTVELTLSVLAVFVFDAVGIGLFTLHVADKHIGWQLLMGLLLSVPVIGGLLIVQRAGFFGLLDKIFAIMLRDTWKKFAGTSMASLDRAVHAMYRRKSRIAICFFWQLMSWLMGVGEIALPLYFLGHPLPLVQCLMIEALIQASSSAAFVIPGALGIQEAGFVLFGGMLGLAPETSAALALMRRCRDLMLYVPGLIVWQLQEGRWLLKNRRAG